MAPKMEEKKVAKPVVDEKTKELKKREKDLPKVNTPDRDAFNATMDAVNAEMQAVNEKIAECNKKISERSTGREEFTKAKDEIRAKLDDLSAQIDKCEKERGTMQTNIDNKQQAGREARDELKSMKKKLGYESEAAIDEKIKEIEYQMMTESLTLTKEKDMLKQISQLKASKPDIKKYAAMESTMGSDGQVSNIRTEKDNIMKGLKELRDRKREQQGLYSKLIETRQKQMGDLPETFERREQLNKEYREKIAKRNELRDAFNKLDREFRAYTNELRSIRNEMYKSERAAKQQEWDTRRAEEKAEEVVEIPFTNEITYIENTIAHLKNLLPKEAEAAKEEASALDLKNKPDGCTVIMSKGDRDMDYYYAPTKGKKMKKAQGVKKGKTITHDLETLTFFDKFKVKVPTNTNDIAATLTTLDEKKAEFVKKQVAAAEKAAKKEEPAAKEEPVAEEVAAVEA